MNKKIIIWRFEDGKAGHDKQSLALVKNIKQLIKCEVINLPIQNLSNPLVGIIFKNFYLPKGFNRPDIAIGAGHKTHLYLLAVKRSFKAKIIVIMKPSLPLSLFDLCVAPKHDCIKKRANVFSTNTSLVNFSLPKKKEIEGLFLIGGPSKHYNWDTDKVLEQIRKIKRKFKSVKLLLTTSRRTPESFISELKNLYSNDIEIYEYSKIKNEWLSNNITKVKNIWVTNDSYSMIIEAIASGANTDILDLKIKRNSKLTREINLIKRQLRKKIPIQDEAKRTSEFIQKLWF